MDFSKIIAIFKYRDLRSKVLFVLAMMVVFRMAANIPIPGVDRDALASFFETNQFFGLMNVFTGGTLENLSIVMLGLGPYITATIIMQLLTLIFPKLKEMYQESGEEGKKNLLNMGEFLLFHWLLFSPLQCFAYCKAVSFGTIYYIVSCQFNYHHHCWLCFFNVDW